MKILQLVALCIIIIAGTFPSNDWYYFPKVDPALSCIYNFIFDGKLYLAKNILFPHGPFAFLMYPQPDNILLATLFLCALKVVITFSIAKLVNANRIFKWLIVLIISYSISLVSELNHLLFFAILLLLLVYYKEEKTHFKVIAFSLTAIAFYVKANVGILSCILCASFLSYYYFKQRNVKTLLIDSITLVGLILMLWMLVFHSIESFPNYLVGMFNLAQDNSAAVAVYPPNNWWLLSGFFIALLLLFLTNQSANAHYFFILIAFSFFASWKHGMAREDVDHVMYFFIYCVFIVVLFSLFIETINLKNIVLSSLVISFFYLNFNSPSTFYFFNYEVTRFQNFRTFCFHLTDLKETSRKKTFQAIQMNKLSDSIRASIGNAPIDIYPWDYTYVTANNLHWQPRPVIQSYAAYTSWLDHQDAAHFSSSIAPEFLLIHKYPEGGGTCYKSIDDRYLLNDEPNTFLELLKNYSFQCDNEKFILFKKNKTPLTISTNHLFTQKTYWNSWISVPYDSTSLVRAKLTFNKPLIKKIKSFFYKDEQVWIYLRLEDGSIRKHRIVPKNAEDGIWINPYISTNESGLRVTQLLFTCSTTNSLSKDLNIDWEATSFKKHRNHIQDFFHLSKQPTSLILYSTKNSFERTATTYWTGIPQENSSTIAHSGKQSSIIEKDNYSTSLVFPLDSIENSNLKIQYEAWIKPNDYSFEKSLFFVMKVIDKNGIIQSETIPIDEQLIDEKEWNHVSFENSFNHQKKGCTLYVFLHNTSTSQVLVDDISIQISSKN